MFAATFRFSNGPFSLLEALSNSPWISLAVRERKFLLSTVIILTTLRFLFLRNALPVLNSANYNLRGQEDEWHRSVG